jgi:hypothetical protein
MITRLDRGNQAAGHDESRLGPIALVTTSRPTIGRSEDDIIRIKSPANRVGFAPDAREMRGTFGHEIGPERDWARYSKTTSTR